MSVRKRTWRTSEGERKEAWIVDYADQNGERHIETFGRKKDADEYHAKVHVGVREGTHTAPAKSPTVAEAAQNWLAYIKGEGRERSTLEQYRQHVDLHIVPRIRAERLAKLTTPRINTLRDDLLAHLSRAMAAKVLKSVKAILHDAQRRGNVAQNVALGVRIGKDKRGKRKLQIEIDIPTPDEIKRIVHAAQGKRRPLVVTMIFAGLRSSELRGLRWSDVDLKKGELHVRQRADHYNVIGHPKSGAGARTIPLGPLVLNTLKEWKLACPKGELGLVFPNRAVRVEARKFIARDLKILLTAVGLQGKYSGLHAFRHFYASWCINRQADGGLGLPAKPYRSAWGTPAS